eukprot:7346805-Prymnesium_polylepis.1
MRRRRPPCRPAAVRGRRVTAARAVRAAARTAATCLRRGSAASAVAARPRRLRCLMHREALRARAVGARVVGGRAAAGPAVRAAWMRPNWRAEVGCRVCGRLGRALCVFVARGERRARSRGEVGGGSRGALEPRGYQQSVGWPRQHIGAEGAAGDGAVRRAWPGRRTSCERRGGIGMRMHTHDTHVRESATTPPSPNPASVRTDAPPACGHTGDTMCMTMMGSRERACGSR